MKKMGTVLVFLLVAAIVVGFIFGIMGGYRLLTTRWDILSDEWKAGMIILSAILIICTLFMTSSIRSNLQKTALSGSGKVMAYNEFIRWYSYLKSPNTDSMDVNSFKSVRNQLVLWGSWHVVKQTHRLVEILESGADKSDQIMDQAENVFGEIKRELGYRRQGKDRDII